MLGDHIVLKKKAATAVPRTATGQFVKGQSGNPAGLVVDPLRTKQKIITLREDLELAVRRGPLTPTRICNVVNKMIQLAEKGDVKAAKLVWAMAMQSHGDEEQGKAPPFIKITVENATFKQADLVNDKPTIRITNAVDAEFSESTKSNG